MSYNDATSRFGCKSSIVQKNTWVKGKENGVNVPPNTQKQTLENTQDTPKSRLPVLSKTKEPIDFQKLHQSWQHQFQKGKALKKKQCTRPQPFNFSQRDRSRVTSDSGQSDNPQASDRRREPLTEVTFGQKNPESKDGGVKDGSEEFKADPIALASILSNVGVPIAATGKLSLAQRVPVRVSSIAQPSNVYKNPMVRSSMYAVLRSQSASTNLDRMSCFSKMQTKVIDQQSVLKQNTLLKSHVPARSIKELAASNQDKPQSQENPVLQQMNRTAQASSVTSLPLRSQEIPSVKSNPVTEDGESSALQADGCEKNKLEVDSTKGKTDPMKTGAASVEFFADSQALASILSNTGVTIGNCGKLSLAQRVPVQGRNVSVKSITTSSTVPIATQPSTPKSCFGRMSTIAVPLKDIVFSPCRVPKTMMTMDKSSSGSAKRVHPLPASAMKFSQPHSVRSKQMFFPKTPRALALEMANKKLEDDCSDTQPSARSTVKWADERSPSVSETLCEMDQVAVRLFIDAECPGETDVKKNLAEESDRLKGSESLTSVQERMGAILPKNSVNKADVSASAGVSQYSPIHTDMDPPAPLSSAHTADPPAPLSSAHTADPPAPLSSAHTADPPAPLSSTHTADPPVQCPSIISSLRTSLPLSFLSHPAVQALQLCTLAGPYSLPDIARLRIQAAVSAKQRFWETCLDEECAFYTSRGAVSSYRSCIDPVSSVLERQEDLHFTPIIPGEP